MTEMEPSGRRHLYLVDGTSQLFRAYYAIRGLTNRDGMSTGAVYGFTTMLRKLIADEAPPYLAVAFDLAGPTFRHARFAGYKAQRPPVPEDLSAQFPHAKDVCRALRIPVLETEGFEADDLIATCTRLARDAGFRVTVVAADKDLLQLVGPGVDVLQPSKNLRLDPQGVANQFGVPPVAVRDVLGLMGDAVDNIPGVPGVGEKTAVAMVATYGGLDAVLERAARWVALVESRDQVLEALASGDGVEAALQRFLARARDLRALEADPGYLARLDAATESVDRLASEVPATPSDAATRLRSTRKLLDALDGGRGRSAWVSTHEHAEQARLSRELATLDDRAPMVFEPADFARRGPDAERARELFAFLGFRSFLEEASHPAAAATEAGGPVPPDRLDASGRLAAFASAARAAGRMALVVAAEGRHPLRMRLEGIGVALGSGEAGYVLWGGEPSDAPTRDVMRALLADPRLLKDTHDLKRALHALASCGIDVKGWGIDTLVGRYLLDPGAGAYDLDARVDATSEGLFASGGPAARGARAAEIARACAKAVPQVADALRRDGLEALYHEVDAPLLPILARMEATGIRVDRRVLESMAVEMDERIAVTRARIVELAGEPFNPDSPKQLRGVLFGKLGLKAVRKTAKSRVESTDAETLEELAEQHEIAREVLAYREMAKLKGTYVDALPALVDPETGRVHTTFDPTGAATGRLSSSDPNLQNIPVRSELGRRIRAAFVADPGHVFLSSDYSQVELRVLAHLCGDPELLAAFRAGEDVHRRTAASLFGVLPILVTEPMRRRAKAVNFGILYGMSESRLARDQGVSRAEARRFIDTYFERFEHVRRYIDDVRERALRDGEVRTLFGRRRRFPQLRDRGSRAATEQALRAAVNTTVQGTAADLMKMAMLAVDRRLHDAGSRARMLLQVHDELLFEVPEGESDAVAALVRDAMEGIGSLAVPLAVDQKTGVNWLEVT